MPLVLDSTGLQIRTLEEIRASLVARYRAKFSPAIRVEPGSVFGDLIDIQALELLSLEEGIEDVYNAFRRPSAEGAALDNLGLLLGVPRLPATKSTAPGTLTGTPATVIPAGSRVRIELGTFWTVRDEATLDGGGSAVVVLEAEDTGPVEANTGTITVIVDSVAGWDTVTNTASATLGRDLETDTAYRLRLRDAADGEGGTDEDIREALLEVDGVSNVSVRSNRDDVTDAEGVPPHHYRAVLYPDTVDPTLIGEALWKAQPTGIDSTGAESATVTDGEGFAQTVRWDWATAIPMYVDLVLTIDATDFPADGSSQVKAAVEAYGAQLAVGEDIYPSQIARAVLNAVPGVLNVAVEVDNSPAPTNTGPVAVAYDQIGTFDAGDVTVS